MGRLLKQKCIDKVPVLSNDRALLSRRNTVYLLVFRSIAVREVSGVDDIVSLLPHPTRKPHGQLRVDKEFHVARACMLLTRLSRAANVSAADTSSGSRSS